LSKQESKQLLKQIFSKKKPTPFFSLSLIDLDVQKYVDKCFDLLEKLDC